jgi:hypothetical protein
MIRLSLGPLAGLLLATGAGAQSAIAACALVPDSTARQTVIKAGELTVCLLAMRADPADTTPRQWATRSHVVVLETQRPGDFRRLALDRGTSWTVNGKPAPMDSTAEAWHHAVVDVLDAAYAVDRLRGLSAQLTATDIPLPTNADSARERLTAIDKRIALLDARIASVLATDRSLDRNIESARRNYEQAARRATDEQGRAARASPQAQAAANAQAQSAQAAANQAYGNYSSLVDRKRRQNAPGEISRMSDEQRTLRARKDLLQLQLQRLDPTNPATMQRASIEQQLTSRQGEVEERSGQSLKRLRAILH